MVFMVNHPLNKKYFYWGVFMFVGEKNRNLIRNGLIYYGVVDKMSFNKMTSNEFYEIGEAFSACAQLDIEADDYDPNIDDGILLHDNESGNIKTYTELWHKFFIDIRGQYIGENNKSKPSDWVHYSIKDADKLFKIMERTLLIRLDEQKYDKHSKKPKNKSKSDNKQAEFTNVKTINKLDKDGIIRFLLKMRLFTGYDLNLLDRESLSCVCNNLKLIKTLALNPGIFYVLHFYSSLNSDKQRKFIDKYIADLLDNDEYKYKQDTNIVFPKYTDTETKTVTKTEVKEMMKDIMEYILSNKMSFLISTLIYRSFNLLHTDSFNLLDKLYVISSSRHALIELYHVLKMIDNDIGNNNRNIVNTEFNSKGYYYNIFTNLISDLNPNKKNKTMFNEYLFNEHGLSVKPESEIYDLTSVSAENIKIDLLENYNEYYDMFVDDSVDTYYNEIEIWENDNAIDEAIDGFIDEHEEWGKKIFVKGIPKEKCNTIYHSMELDDKGENYYMPLNYYIGYFILKEFPYDENDT